ncbi:HNH endonuclease [Salmonella enterica]|nr:HNH endonuclease [Salmonella enterica]
MAIQLRGRTIDAPFAFICDGKAYYSFGGESWTNLQIQHGYANAHSYCYDWRYRRVPCTNKRSGELTEAFKRALMRQTGHKFMEIGLYMKKQAEKGNQILIEGQSVRVVSSSSTVTPKGFESTVAPVPLETAKPEKKKKKKTGEGMAIHFAMLRTKGVPEGREQEFHDWHKANPSLVKGIPIGDAVVLWKRHCEFPEDSIQPVPAPKKEHKLIAGSAIANGYRSRGVPKDRLQEYHEWFLNRSSQYHGVKLHKVIADWKAEVGLVDAPAAPAAPVVYEIPVPPLCLPAPTPESLAADKARKASAKASRKYQKRKARERKKRELVEEREHEEDVPFYGRRRRNQAQFRADVGQNCGYRCVFTFASDARCDAAHLLAHARKGGASFKNGILLRKDIHALMDEGHCAIEPDTLQLWFSEEILESDPDLRKYQGMKMRPTDKPIKRENLMARWDAFLARYMGDE